MDLINIDSWIFFSDASIVTVGNSQELDLGIVVNYVLNGISFYLEENNFVSKIKNKLESIPAMTTDEVKQVWVAIIIFCFFVKNYIP